MDLQDEELVLVCALILVSLDYNVVKRMLLRRVIGMECESFIR